MWLDDDVFEVTGDTSESLVNTVELLGKLSVGKVHPGRPHPGWGYKVTGKGVEVFVSSYRSSEDVNWLPSGVGISSLAGLLVEWWGNENNRVLWQNERNSPRTDGSYDVGWKVTRQQENFQYGSGFLGRVEFAWRIYGK